jgi:hypothetical protein
MRPDEFCGTMLSIYELYHNLPLGGSSISYLMANPDAENSSLVDVAAFVGLVNEELLNKFTEADEKQLTAEDAAKMLMTGLLSESMNHSTLRRWSSLQEKKSGPARSSFTASPWAARQLQSTHQT